MDNAPKHKIYFICKDMNDRVSNQIFLYCLIQVFYIANIFVVKKNSYAEKYNLKQKESKTTTFFFVKLCYKELCETCLRHVIEGHGFRVYRVLYSERIVGRQFFVC